MKLLLSAVNIALLSASMPLASAYVLTLRPVADTALFENRPSNNLGAQLFMPVGLTDVPNRARGLMRFDLTQLPSNAVISAVSLRISSVFGGGGTQTYEVHRMLVPWNEGTKSSAPDRNGGIGASATAGETTWNHREHPSVPWQVAGGGAGVDFETTASGSVNLTGPGNYTINSPGVMEDVARWRTNAAVNYGWLLKDGAETARQTARRIGSREDANNAPVLTITYAAPGPSLTNTSPLPFADLGVPYSYAFGATDGVPPYVWGSGGILPRGLTLNPQTGVLSGTPTNAGTVTFAIRPTDSLNINTSRNFTITIDAKPFIALHSISSQQFSLAFPALSTRQYAVEYRDSLETGLWSTLIQTNVPVNSTVHVQDALSPGQRYYRLRKN